MTRALSLIDVDTPLLCACDSSPDFGFDFGFGVGLGSGRDGGSVSTTVRDIAGTVMAGATQ